MNSGFNLRLTQSDRTLQGFIYVCLNEIDGITGRVESDGTISLAGAGAVGTYDPMTLMSFHSTISGTTMTGTFARTVNPGTPYAISWTGTLKDVVLVSRDPNVPY